MSVEIKGLDSLVRKLNQLGGNVDNAMYKGIGKAMTVIEGDAKDLCPVDRGELRDSIHSKVERVSGSVKGTTGTNKEYATYVEFGTGQRGAESPSPPKAPIGDGYREDWTGMPAQPYLYPALVANKPYVSEIIAKELKAEIQKLGG